MISGSDDRSTLSVRIDPEASALFGPWRSLPRSPEKGTLLAKLKRTRARRYRLDVGHFLRPLGTATVGELRQLNASEQHMREIELARGA